MFCEPLKEWRASIAASAKKRVNPHEKNVFSSYVNDTSEVSTMMTITDMYVAM